MAAENGYASQFSYELYDTTGTTEDWSYYATGGLGYTFEIGPEHFHPPFAETVAEYEGGNRAAYFLAQENTADATKHSVLTGRAPAGATLRLKKSFETPTSQDTTFTDTLDSTMQVGADGTFEWHVNPSTRPLVAQERGREATGEPSPPAQFAARGESTPCANFDDPPETCYEDHVITVPAGEGIDNARATIRVEWATPVSDYDVKVYRDGVEVGSSGQSTTNFEQVVLGDPAPGEYVVRVVNYAAAEPWTGTVTFEGPEAFEPARTETWTLFCEDPDGTIRSAQQVGIVRGERRTLDLRAACVAELVASVSDPPGPTRARRAYARAMEPISLAVVGGARARRGRQVPLRAGRRGDQALALQARRPGARSRRARRSRASSSPKPLDPAAMERLADEIAELRRALGAVRRRRRPGAGRPERHRARRGRRSPAPLARGGARAADPLHRRVPAVRAAGRGRSRTSTTCSATWPASAPAASAAAWCAAA